MLRFCLYLFFFYQGLLTQNYENNSSFKQLDERLPSPNLYRDASGSATAKYWQQQADYNIQVSLDEENLRIRGKEELSYTNNSPNVLRYIWIQLDQNKRKLDSHANLAKSAEKFPNDNVFSFDEYAKATKAFDGGLVISSLTTKSGEKLKYIIDGTMMRVDLPKPLKTGKKFSMKISWSYLINDLTNEGRSGYEFFAEDSNYVFNIAQFFPRVAKYNDVRGWQTNQFLGQAEFALEFGNYDVKITVPADHIVAATGTLQNESAVLSTDQRKRLYRQRREDHIRFITNPDEAAKAVKSKTRKKKTWHFKASNVRDFAFASSRRFIWDASSVKIGNKRVLTMSYYPKEAMPLWDKYSTHLIRHTLKTYSKYTFDYPYEQVSSVHAPDQIGGMEYPMISFNSTRPSADGSFTKAMRDYFILLIIHEVGHIYFPMIINSDERQWAWMDEGLNSFLQFLAEREWDPNYDSQAGPADLIVPFMKSDNQNPIMTNAETIKNTAIINYDKPTAMLNILRETVLGRELFDFAFKEYARRWKFKSPEPADFFRTMEDASGRDLDWFWYNAFYTTKYVNQAIDSVLVFTQESIDPRVLLKEYKAAEEHITDKRNNISDGGYAKRNKIIDPYADLDLNKPFLEDTAYTDSYLASLSREERKLAEDTCFFYKVIIKNVDDKSMPMPIILKLKYKSGKSDTLRIPAKAWLRNERRFAKAISSKEEIESFELDPLHELPDIDRNDNIFPQEIIKKRFQLFKMSQEIIEVESDSTSN